MLFLTEISRDTGLFDAQLLVMLLSVICFPCGFCSTTDGVICHDDKLTVTVPTLMWVEVGVVSVMWLYHLLPLTCAVLSLVGF